MTPEQYRRAGEIFHDALATPAEGRQAIVERACAGDAELCAEVESLLAAHAEAGEFIASPHRALAAGASSAVRDGSFDALEPIDPGDADALLEPGRRLGRYTIVDVLGAGGMGRVYRAFDDTLGREVAIKGLARTFDGDPDSLRRFEREARMLATLSHPNIAAIFGFERFGGSPYLVLERVEGGTLADRLARGPMRVADAVAAALQVAAGLEEAHAKGIVHRDLKPSNVMLTKDARIKLVDFGLAKTTESHPLAAGSPRPITATGVVLGTARYMSPEQVRGEEVDTRTDVWAFGCVLYEMLTGKPVFGGRSVSEVVAAVLRDEPDWQALPPGLPQPIHRLLTRCLRRDVRSRLQHVGDARLELAEADEVAAAAPAFEASRRRARWILPAAIVAAASLGAAVALWWPRTPSERTAVQLSVELPAGVTLANDLSAPYAVAPAGSRLVFEAVEGGTRRLYVRDLSDPRLRPLAGTEDARQPFFSPDGRWVGFFAHRKLAKVPVGGGPVLQLADIGGNPRGAAWAPGGTIVVAPTQTSGLARVPDVGGRPVAVTSPDKRQGEYSHRWPSVLPGGEWILYTVGREDAPYDEGRIEAVSLATGERRPVVSGAGFARYVPDGRLLFIRGGRAHAVRFDTDRVAVHGTPEVVLDAVRYNPQNGGSHLAVGASGTLLYTPGEPISSEYYVSWTDREGRLVRVTDTPRAFRDVKVSPDGRRLAAVIGTSTEGDLWIIDATGTLSRLSTGVSAHRPAWTARGDAVTVGAHSNGRWQLMTIATEGRQDPVVLFESANRLYPNGWSADGGSLLFQELDPETGWNLRVLRLDGSGRAAGAPMAFADTPVHEANASLSPDGRWVAYESDEIDDVVQIYARSFPSGEHKVRVSPAGARWPAWDARGNLHYWQTEDDTLQVVTTKEQDGRLSIGAAQPVWPSQAESAVSRHIVITVGGARYDVDSSGFRFAVLERSRSGSKPPLSAPTIVLGRR
jgi:serine/threonine-protein kinase